MRRREMLKATAGVAAAWCVPGHSGRPAFGAFAPSNRINVGFIGLGIMGSPMAANLVKAGHPVAGHTRSRAGLDRLAAAGGRAATGIAGAVRDAILRPALQRRHQGVLGQLFGQPDVAHDARHAADDAAGFNPPHRRDGVFDPGRHCPSLGGMLSI